MSFTLGFEDSLKLATHYAKHGAEFGGITQAEYALLADTFLGSPLNPVNQLECRRRSGDVVRLDLTTNEFGVLSKGGHIRTYFKPDPRVHGHSSNIDYFHSECGK